MIDLDARYRVADMPGVAWWIKGHPTTREECQGHPCEDAADMYPHSGIGEAFFCDGSCEDPVEDVTLVIAVMVGDNREHIVDVDDLVMIDDDAYCHGCGQIGCGHS